ncbi:nose resistant to fluoxetine protein 6-like [Trichoplusia ni]|uniref:Nose resistant to fluoxetine protein 6-like n=1 Tax=Trichoplusia ni TaxID=7111 RepID=A0A7E5WF83_TRINI|nr:nose resistant to fluoxetine protein 6-like [Trichoplusia ni]
MFAVLSALFFIGGSGAVIYNLEDSDYARMPPIVQLDPYDACFRDPDDLYCTARLVLVSDEPSPLLSMIKEYSAHKSTHYNYTELYRGVCVTQNCKQFHDKTTENLTLTLEACLNESFYSNYELKTRVFDDYDCTKRERSMKLDDVHWYVAAVCVLILCANIVGSLYDFSFRGRKKTEDSAILRFLNCFSLRRNWKKLVGPASEDRDPRLQKLQCIHGIRALTMGLVISGHTFLILIVLPENPKFMEEMYMNNIIRIIVNGTGIMQTFLLVSSFLLVYTSLINMEKKQLSWTMLPKYIIMRWLRLTPAYALVVALTATWFGRITTGPLYKKLIADEVTDCRSSWWQNILYINNYADNSECMVQSWYLGADTQLYYLAAFVFVTCRTNRSRKIAVTLMFVLGTIFATGHTYFQQLNGVLVVSPSVVLKMFIKDPTFNHLYKRGHTNLTGCTIGMAMAYFVYHWQKKGVNKKKLQSYRFLYWTLFPVGCLICLSGSMYYDDAPPPPPYVNVLFAALHKPLFGAMVASVIIGVIFEVDDLYRSILEWPGWTVPSRLTYSTYLVHIAFIRNYGCMQTTLRMSYLVLIRVGLLTVVASYALGLTMFMLVESPFANLVTEYTKKKAIRESGKENGSAKHMPNKENKKVSKKEL